MMRKVNFYASTLSEDNFEQDPRSATKNMTQKKNKPFMKNIELACVLDSDLKQQKFEELKNIVLVELTRLMGVSELERGKNRDRDDEDDDDQEYHILSKLRTKSNLKSTVSDIIKSFSYQ